MRDDAVDAGFGLMGLSRPLVLMAELLIRGDLSKVVQTVVEYVTGCAGGESRKIDLKSIEVLIEW